MSGRITAVNLNAETVVIEVPVKNEQMTVAGPVLEGAQLEKKGQPADLESFDIGDWVQVTWGKTDETLLIRELALR